MSDEKRIVHDGWQPTDKGYQPTGTSKQQNNGYQPPKQSQPTQTVVPPPKNR